MTRLQMTAALMIAGLGAVAAQDWNQWRGPSRSGAADAFTAPARWPDRPTKVWQVKAGTGHSSPVVSAGRVFLLSRIGSQEAVTAYELATGTQVWRQTYDAPYEMNPAAVGHGKGPKSTPVVSGGRVYTFGISGILSAFDAASGRVIWRTDFRSRFPSASPEFGTAMSPIVTGGLVIVHAGGNGKGAVVAFDEKKGDAVRWTWTGDGPAYSSPVVALVDGVRLLVTQTQSRVVALSLADGRLAWDVPFTTDYDQNIVTPVVQDDVVIYSGLSKPLTAVRVARAGGKWQTTRLWQNPELPMYMSSPVAANGLLFGLTHRNRGQFFCADARTGRTLWVTRGREGENAALVVAGGLLLAATTEGELVVARPSATSFDVVKRYTVAESPVWAHPVPTGSGVLIKDAETLALWTF